MNYARRRPPARAPPSPSASARLTSQFRSVDLIASSVHLQVPAGAVRTVASQDQPDPIRALCGPAWQVLYAALVMDTVRVACRAFAIRSSTVIVGMPPPR